MKFWKYEGAGNDFVMIDLRDQSVTLDKEMIVRLCDRHRGVGADGVITLSVAPDLTMHYYNADGSEGEMCGNGARCFVRFAHDLGVDCNPLIFKALDGMHEGRILDDGRVEVGLKDVSIEELLLDTGVPHYVEFVDDLKDVDVEGRGRTLRHDKRFPQGANVDFAQVVTPSHLCVRTYERGVEGETLACGTGAAAAAVAAHRAERVAGNRIHVTMPGGELEIAFSDNYTDVKLIGPARKIFEGVW